MSEPVPPAEPAAEPKGFVAWWRSWRAKYEKLVEEYGWVAVGTYLVLFVGTWFGFWLAIRQGFTTEGGSSAGTVGGAWLATKATQPLRIGATLLLTPLVMRAKRALRPG